MSNLPITEFVNYIYSDYHEKKIVYIAIGSAHYRTEIINGVKQIDDKSNKNYHYPLILYFLCICKI